MADSTTIGPDTAISGRIEGSTDLSVEGFVDGTIELSETLTIAAGGRVNGQIQARQVVIEGSFDGEIAAEQRVVLTDTARAIANITAPLVEMADGARIRGELTVGANGEVSTPATSERSRSERSTTTSRTSTTSASASTSAPAKTQRSTTASGASSTARSSAPTATTTVVEESAEDDDDEGESEPAQSEDAKTPQDSTEADEQPYSEETFEQYRQDYTVKELRDELRDLDLQVSGTKDELIERLLTGED